MSISETKIENRIIFFDNLRLLFVVFVILEHSSNAYTNIIWWPVADKSTSIIAGWLSAFSDACSMPLLFYIAGYFALPTIEKKGVWFFLTGKLKRLGIPWLVCILVICPILPLIYHFTRNGLSLSMSYLDLWVDLIKNAAEFNVGLIVSMNQLMMNNQFYQRYMWFLSLLLLFFFIVSLLYMFKKDWFKQIDQPDTKVCPSISSTLKFLFGVGFLTAVCSFLMTGAMLAFGPNPEPLFTLGNVIQFRPSRLFPYLIFFGLGLMTYKNRWIERGKFPGHFRTWAISCISLLLLYLLVRSQMLNSSNHLKEIYGMVFFFILHFLTVAVLGFFTSIGIRYWNRPTDFEGKMTSNSYDMYLSHYVFVIVFQLILFTFPGVPGLLKFSIVSALSIICAYIVSQFFIKPFPRISILATIIMFIAMVLLIRP
jgi:glucans biosynthesis protein C